MSLKPGDLVRFWTKNWPSGVKAIQVPTTEEIPGKSTENTGQGLYTGYGKVERIKEGNLWVREAGSSRTVEISAGERVEPLNCPGKNIQFRDDLLDRSLLDNEFWRFACPWFQKARTEGAEHKQYFDGLIYLWVMFNAWLGQVVSNRKFSERDSDLVQAAACDRELNLEFQRLLTEDDAFASTIDNFRSLWPVFKVRALQEHQLPAWSDETSGRASYLLQCFDKNLERKDYAPPCFKDHQPDPNNPATFSPTHVPLDWSHTLSAIYKVRCSLFHGGKSFHNRGDQLFVKFAFTILWRLWGERQFERCCSRH